MVKQVALVREVPPAVAGDAAHADRYVAAAQDLGPLELPRRHPYIALNSEQIEGVRSRGEAYRGWLASTVRAADALCAAPTVVPEQGDVYSMDYFCPQHGVPLQWRADFPHEHLCPEGGETLTGAKLDQEWRINRDINAHRSNRSALRTLGYAYVFAADEKYAGKSREILLGYADKFPNYLWHSGRGQLVAEGNGMRAAYEPLGEAGWLADMVLGYDLVAASPAFTEAERRAIEGMFRDDVRVSLRYDEGLSNRQCHHNLAVGATGLCLRDETLIRRTVGSFRYQMKYGVLGDGLWWECSPGYGSYAMNTVLELVQMLGRAGVDLTDEPKLKLAFDAPLAFLFPDQTFPGVNDSHWRPALSWDRYDYLYGIYPDPRYATLLSDKDRAGTLTYLLYGRELGAQEPLPSASHLFPQAGMAMLKPGADPDAPAVCFDWGQTVSGHGHADKLNILLYGKGELLGPDNGSRSYFSPVWRFWDRQTLSHNTVVINERSQEHRKGRLELYEAHPGLAVCQATADDVYTGLRQRRTLFATPDYLVDMFRVAQDSTDLALRPEPVGVIPHWRREPWGDDTPERLARDSALLQRTEHAHLGRFAALVGHTQQVDAAWATPPRMTTGQNQGLYHAQIPVKPGATYRFSFWAKCVDASGNNAVTLYWQNAEARALGQVTVPVPANTTQWTQFSRQAEAPDAADHAAVRIGSSGNPGVFLVDDLTLCTEDAPDTNALALNADFETTDTAVATIDWTYHNLGKLSCPVASRSTDLQMGKPGDDPYWDGENGYRYMSHLRTGDPTTDDWRASWVADESNGVGLELTMLGQPGTQVFTADGQGPGTMRVPLVIARRRKADTVFGAVMEPVRGKGQVRDAKRLPCTVDGRAASAVEAYGVAVQMPDRVDYYMVSYSQGEKRFGPITLTPHEGALNCLATVSVLGEPEDAAPGPGGVLRAYVVGGSVSWGGWKVTSPPIYHGHVLSCDDAAKTLVADCALPSGRALAGAALCLDLPYNVALTVDTVDKTKEGCLIRLRDLPNLQPTPGSPFTIATGALVSLRAHRVYELWAQAGAELRMPSEPDLRTAEVGATDQALRDCGVPPGAEELVVRLGEADVPERRAYLVLDRPVGGSLSDTTPPALTSIEVDGRAVQPAAYLQLPRSPGRLVVVFADDGSGVSPEPVRFLLNGEPAAADAGVTLTREGGPGALQVTVAGDGGTRLQTLHLAVSDNSLLRNESLFTLRVVQAAQAVALGDASGGRAVALTGGQAEIEMKLDLPAGDYKLDLVGYGPDLGSNSLWLAVDGERVDDVVHLPVGRPGSCSRDVDITPALPRFRVATAGEHTLRLTLREAPGTVIDRASIVGGGGVVAEAEAEDMGW